MGWASTTYFTSNHWCQVGRGDSCPESGVGRWAPFQTVFTKHAPATQEKIKICLIYRLGPLYSSVLPRHRRNHTHRQTNTGYSNYCSIPLERLLLFTARLSKLAPIHQSHSVPPPKNHAHQNPRILRSSSSTLAFPCSSRELSSISIPYDY